MSVSCGRKGDVSSVICLWKKLAATDMQPRPKHKGLRSRAGRKLTQHQSPVLKRTGNSLAGFATRQPQMWFFCDPEIIT